MNLQKSRPERRPPWIRSILPGGNDYGRIKRELGRQNISTVCMEANCPNLGECWNAGVATLMILGDTCTRACRFCNVKTGNPKGVIDQQEIESAVRMVQAMNLNYLVITSVDRDDLSDLGAGHFSNVILAVKQNCPEVMVEVLIPDFNGKMESMHTLAKSSPFVIAQNIETVERLTSSVRDRRAGYQQTLDALAFYKKHYPDIATKSSIMVGLGETFDEIKKTMDDLLEHQVDILTLGQYLRPTLKHLPVVCYYTPDEFENLKEIAYLRGFKFVISGPLVRSSYRASDYLSFLDKNKRQKEETRY